MVHLFPFSLKIIFSAFVLLASIIRLTAQPYAVPAEEDTTTFGAGISRTMHLLATSTPSKRNTVKILVYGQSISEQNWWLDVKNDLITRYPNANLIMENRAIGGFASQLLKKPMYFDVMPFYPDMVIFHVYGSQFSYDTIVSEIRRLTTAEIAIHNDQGMPGKDSTTNWDDYMSYVVRPRAANKYKLEMMDIRTPWGKYLNDNNLQHGQLTADGLHLNDHGNYLLAALIKRHLAYKSKFPVDPYGLVKTYEVGKDINVINGKITLPFNGNKVDIIAASPDGIVDSARVLIDGKKPSEFEGCYAFTRPNGSPWTGSIIKITSERPLLLEDWTATITSINCTASNCTFNFSLQGSKTGNDGSGSVSYDNKGIPTSPAFVSNSKRIVIKADDWYIREVILQNGSNSVKQGHQIKWSVVPLYKDYYKAPSTIADPTVEDITTVAQGIENKNHTLELTFLGNKNVPIKAIRVYRPYWMRDSAQVLSVYNESVIDNIEIFPNPASKNIFIRSTNLSDQLGVIGIYDVVGQRVEGINIDEESGSLTKKISFAGLKPGIYFIEFKVNSQPKRRKIQVL